MLGDGSIDTNQMPEMDLIPDELIESWMVTWDVQDYENYKGINLMSYTMKLWERVVGICRTPIYPERDGGEDRAAKRSLVEKEDDFAPLSKLCDAMRQHGVGPCYIWTVKDMYQAATSISIYLGTLPTASVSHCVHHVFSFNLFALLCQRSIALVCLCILC